MNRIIESKEGLAVAGEVLMSISKDERERAIFRSRRIALADQESNRITLIRNERLTIARNLLKAGDSADKITMVTGLTHAEVEALRADT